MKTTFNILGLSLLSPCIVNNASPRISPSELQNLIKERAVGKRNRESNPIDSHPKFHNYHPMALDGFKENFAMTFMAKISDVEAWKQASVLLSGPAIKCSTSNEWVVPFVATKNQVATLLDQPYLVWILMAKDSLRSSAALELQNQESLEHFNKALKELSAAREASYQSDATYQKIHNEMTRLRQLIEQTNDQLQPYKDQLQSYEKQLKETSRQLDECQRETIIRNISNVRI